MKKTKLDMLMMALVTAIIFASVTLVFLVAIFTIIGYWFP